MKLTIGKTLIDIKKNGVEWGPKKLNRTFYYFYWWNLLPKEYRYWGAEYIWYDGPHRTFGFWYCSISWSTPWTKVESE